MTGETQPIMRMVEVFPAPFGPRKPKASPRCDVEVDPVDRDEFAEALDEVPCVDQWLPVVGGHARHATDADQVRRDRESGRL